MVKLYIQSHRVRDAEREFTFMDLGSKSTPHPQRFPSALRASWNHRNRYCILISAQPIRSEAILSLLFSQEPLECGQSCPCPLGQRLQADCLDFV